VRAAAGNVDVAPTVLALLGHEPDRAHRAEDAALDGRVLAEALEHGPDPEQVIEETRVHVARANGYRAAIQVTEVDGRRYVDKGWRVS
jgi:arylsulfatase A-like enzyme